MNLAGAAVDGASLEEEIVFRDSFEEDLDPETLTGIDRLLNASAAWNDVNQACIVIDAGTSRTYGGTGLGLALVQLPS